jgi:Trypsin-like peptidase domain
MLKTPLLCIVLFLCVASFWGQTSAQPRPEPAMLQIKKSVPFVELTCKDAGQSYTVNGTGFFVAYPDKRLKENKTFIYFVTNRHVALCWKSTGHPMEVKSIAFQMNLRSPVHDKFSQQFVLNQSGNLPWILPSDESVDLAVFPIAPSTQVVDYKVIPISMLATKDVLDSNRIHEGEPVFFAGFFYQFPGFKRIEPIVRQGIIAMMPDEPFPFVGHPQHLHLADVHAFGGNSGAPVFINLGGMHENTITSGQDYRLLGVINGEIFEDENFNLELATTVTGTGKANSGVSTMVPADELKQLLDSAQLQGMRDEIVAGQR